MRWLLVPTLCLAVYAGRAQSIPALPPDQATLEAYYRLTYRPDSTDTAPRNELVRLRMGSRLSRFESKSKLFRDSLFVVLQTNMERQKAAGEQPSISFKGLPPNSFATNFKGVTFKVPTANEVVVYDEIGTVRYVYQEPTPWPGPSCLPRPPWRATTSFGGRQWEAWFTREVPVSDGPYKFYGLPGLIVKVGDTRGYYVFELAQLRKLPAPVAIALPEAGAKPISRADFLRGKAEYDRNAFTQMLAGGGFRFNRPEDAEQARQKARDNARKRNNPLELR